MVSPIITNTPISGPTSLFMKLCGFDPSSISIIEMYKDFMNVFVYDKRDKNITEEIIKFYSKKYNIKFIKSDIILNSTEKRIELAKLIISTID